jgi:hypothetical protein
MTLAEKIKVYLTEDIFVNEVIRNQSIIIRNDLDEKGDYIEKWDYEGKSQPTQEQLDAIQ